MPTDVPSTPRRFVDHIGRPLAVGDLVAVTRSGYASPTMGTVAAFTPKNVRVQLAGKFTGGRLGALPRSAGETFIAHTTQMVVVQPLPEQE
ncbi:hypothetical protein LG293_16120 (plasmid) [Citricoccus nitrophenolicus]